MSSTDKVYIFGKHIYNFHEAASLINDHKVLFLDYDDKSWKDVGVWLTPEIVDEMYMHVNDQTYLNDCYIIDPVIFKDGDMCKIKKGKYQFCAVSRIDDKLQKH